MLQRFPSTASQRRRSDPARPWRPERAGLRETFWRKIRAASAARLTEPTRLMLISKTDL